MQATNRNQDDASIANRYLAGQLSAAEEEAYEQYFVRNPDAVQELEATARMKVGLANLRDTGQLDALLRAPAAPAFDRRKAMLALVASLAFVVIGVGVWRGVSVPDSATLMATAAELVDKSGRPLAVGASYALMRMRDVSNYDATVELPEQREAIQLRVRPESIAPRYTVTLSRIRPDGSTQIGTLNNLASQADGFVQLYVDSSRLQPGTYLLVVSQTGDEAALSTSSFRLKVLKPALRG